ncbi:spindle pole body interacting protein [Linderina pennispora]|uniref:Spindle pole body interacting protein n=1 Tax=Linderina pennispora TaxID=61395 RepID=A0A1Y1WFI9_9FUNG|nr:spindle pole body interacting protein [Linderina pennispora]ORX72283.1 spindle pole body interacting protein [Linderina pennispora]
MTDPSGSGGDAGEQSQLNVEYILLAEFDIDRGAILKHQYPRPTGADDSHLAELMLPDGAHARESDWTMFFLNQKAPDETGKVTQEGPPLLYVLNLVRTKHDKEVRRGAIVKAMAVCTRHRFIHIYQAILMLALENYYRSPTVDTLAELFASVNAMDLTCMPQLSRHEITILRFSDDQNMFEERFIELEDEKKMLESLTRDSERLEIAKDSALAELAPSNDESSGTSARRGTVSDTAAPGRMRMPSTRNKDRRFFDTEIVYSGVKLPIRVPMTVYPEEISDFSLIQLLTTFAGSLPTPSGSGRVSHPHLDSSGQYTHPIILLMNGLLTQKRVIFLGHGKPAGEVANYVLAAVALGSGGGGVLRGFANRAFPYTNLTNLDTLLSFPGYIAGWWDLLCNINTGKITVSPALALPNGSTAGHSKSQTDSLRRSLDSVSLSRTRSFSSREGKPDKWNNLDTEFIPGPAIRSKVENYVRRFMSLVPLYEFEQRGTTKLGDPGLITHKDKSSISGYIISAGDKESREREISFYQSRIEGFIGTQAYHNAVTDYQSMQASSFIRGVDIAHMVTCLRNSTNLDVNEVEAIYKHLDEQVVTNEQVTELLASLPQSQGGLHPLAYGFYHPSPKIRYYTVRLFEKIECNQAGARYIRSTNFFHQCAFSNLRHTFTA